MICSFDGETVAPRCAVGPPFGASVPFGGGTDCCEEALFGRGGGGRFCAGDARRLMSIACGTGLSPSDMYC